MCIGPLDEPYRNRVRLQVTSNVGGHMPDQPRRIRSRRMLRGATDRLEDVEQAMEDISDGPVNRTEQDFVALVESMLHEGI